MKFMRLDNDSESGSSITRSCKHGDVRKASRKGMKIQQSRLIRKEDKEGLHNPHDLIYFNLNRPRINFAITDPTLGSCDGLTILRRDPRRRLFPRDFLPGNWSCGRATEPKKGEGSDGRDEARSDRRTGSSGNGTATSGLAVVA